MKRTTVKRAFIIILISVLMLCFTGCKGKVINQVASGGADKEPGSDEHSGEGNLPGANNQQEENSPQVQQQKLQISLRWVFLWLKISLALSRSGNQYAACSTGTA